MDKGGKVKVSFYCQLGSIQISALKCSSRHICEGFFRLGQDSAYITVDHIIPWAALSGRIAPISLCFLAVVVCGWLSQPPNELSPQTVRRNKPSFHKLVLSGILLQQRKNIINTASVLKGLLYSFNPSIKMKQNE